MDRQTQIEILLDHFNNPRNKKKLADADVDLPGGNPGCGDVVRIYLNVDADQDPTRIAEVAFEGSGCTISQAAASILMEMMNAARPPLDEILAMDFEDMVDVLGRETVSSRPRCATLALGTLKAAVTRYRRNQLRAEHGLEAETSAYQAEPEDFQN